MEKFARHALMDGVTDVGCLAVGRESELFRALSMHYNKASDFQVTDGAQDAFFYVLGINKTKILLKSIGLNKVILKKVWISAVTSLCIKP